MRKTNVVVKIDLNGNVEVHRISKTNKRSVSAYNVVAVEGLKELALVCMKKGAEKVLQSMREKASAASEASGTKQPIRQAADNQNNQGGQTMNKIQTGDKMFTNIKPVRIPGQKRQSRAVTVDVAGVGRVMIGYHKAKNQFLMAWGDGIVKETTKWEVIKALSKYQGKDVAYLVRCIQNLKPVVWHAEVCEACGKGVSKGVMEYSKKHYDGHVYCMDCQKEAGPASEASGEPMQASDACPLYRVGNMLLPNGIECPCGCDAYVIPFSGEYKCFCGYRISEETYIELGTKRLLEDKDYHLFLEGKIPALLFSNRKNNMGIPVTERQVMIDELYNEGWTLNNNGILVFNGGGDDGPTLYREGNTSVHQHGDLAVIHEEGDSSLYREEDNHESVKSHNAEGDDNSSLYREEEIDLPWFTDEELEEVDLKSHNAPPSAPSVISASDVLKALSEDIRSDNSRGEQAAVAKEQGEH